jgi:hypothetical protein
MHSHSHTACMGKNLGGLGGVQLREAEEAYQQPDLPCLKREETVFQGDTSGGRGLGHKHTGLGCRLVRDDRGSNHTCQPSHHRRRGQTKRRARMGAPAASRTMAQISGVRAMVTFYCLACVYLRVAGRGRSAIIDWSRCMAHGDCAVLRGWTWLRSCGRSLLRDQSHT